MHKRSGKHHRALGSSIAELNARDAPAAVPHPPVDPAPTASPPPSSEPSDATRSSALPSSRLTSSSTDDARSKSRAPSTSGTSVSRNSVSVGGQSVPASVGAGSSTATSAVPPRSTPRVPPTALPSSVGSSSAASSSSTDISKNSIGTGGRSTSTNTGARTCTSTSVVLDTCTSSMLVTSIPPSSQYSPGPAFSPTSTTFSPPAITTSADISSGKHLSGRTVADIIIVSLFSLLALILVVVGRYLIARNVERRRQSLGHRSSSTDLIIARNESPRNSVALGGAAPTSRRSSLSSFVTNFDQELSGVHSPGIVPDLPPLAEVRERNPVIISTRGTTIGRESMNGVLSSENDPDYWYPGVLGQDDLEPSARTSVPPSSFSESFAFPRPPAPLAFTTDSVIFPGKQTILFPRPSATRIPLGAPLRAFMKGHPPSALTPSPYPQTPTSNIRLPPPITPINIPIPPLPDLKEPGLSTVKVIRRPFRPSQVDELAVLPGDRIRLLRIFDDGWAFIEKLASPEGGRHEHGLIPVDCLREVSQAFLTQQRVSIYGSG